MERIKIEKIVRAKRKTVRIDAISENSVCIYAPHNVSVQEIEKILLKHKRAIAKILSKAKVKRKFVESEKFPNTGKFYPLKIVENQTVPLIFENGTFRLSGNVKDKRKAFFEWYKARSAEIVSERVSVFSKRCGVEYRSVRITSAESRWGSCSKKGNLNFSYRIAMLPPFAIDYIVVHELCHIIEFNHSKAFYELVEKVLPDYGKSVRYLKENGYLFRL